MSVTSFLRFCATGFGALPSNSIVAQRNKTSGAVSIVKAILNFEMTDLVFAAIVTVMGFAMATMRVKPIILEELDKTSLVANS